MIKVDEDFIPIKQRFSTEYHLKDALSELNHPEKDIKTINVVGTNGKGSVSFYTSVGLKQKFKKIGLFISPAFIYQNERIQINNEYISDEKLKSYLQLINNLIEKYHLTFFEIWTLIAILYFKDEQVEYAVIEAGIGGIKDATYCFSNQIATLLTSVAFDHTEILGETIEEILENKVLMAKPGSIIFVSSDNKKYQKIINQIAFKNQIKVVFGESYYDKIHYQINNKGLVKTFLAQEFNFSNFEFLKLNPPLGRFTILDTQPFFVIDGAHNPDGIQNLIQTYRKFRPHHEPIVLMGSSYQKDYLKSLNELEKNFDDVYVTNFEHFKSWDIEKLEAKNKVANWKKFLKEKLQYNQDIVVCGSLYFIPLVYDWFKDLKKE